MDTPTEDFKVDGWMSLLTSLGHPSRDKAEHFGFWRHGRLTSDTLDALYRQDPIAARIIDVPVDDMMRAGHQLVFAGDDDEGEALDADAVNKFRTEVHNWSKRVRLKRHVKRALKQERAYGGSLIILGVDDGQDDLSKPLNENGIRSFDWLYAADRYQVSSGPPTMDPASPNFGLPEWYRVSSSFGAVGGQRPMRDIVNVEIHHTRCIRLDGVTISDRERLTNDGWGDSMLDRVFEPLRNWNASMKACVALVQDFSQGIYKLKGLREILAANQESLVAKRFQIIDLAKSIINAIVLDADGEDYERKSTNVAGLPDIIDRFGLHLSASSGMPLTLILGVSPGGFGTGQAEGENWDDVVAASQEEKLVPILDRIYTLLFLSTAFGSAPGTWSAVCNPLVQPSEDEEASRRKTIAETDAMYIDRGVLSPAEVTSSRFGSGVFSGETTLDKDARSEMDEVEPEEAEPTPATGAPGEEKAQDAALNGAQISSMLEIVKAVVVGDIPRDTGVNILARAFLISPSEADQLMGTADKKEQPEPAPTQGGAPPFQTQQQPSGAPSGQPPAEDETEPENPSEG